MDNSERAVISVVGKDHPGILAFASAFCAERDVNIVDVTQKVLADDMFTMIMIVEIPEGSDRLRTFAADLEAAGEEHALKIHVMHEGIFNAMHTI